MSFTPTPEQLAIVAAATDTTDNLLVSALAGAAKTSTLVLIAEALCSKQILCLAFNKKIADEMKERLPPNCECRTLNSLGYMIWRETVRGVRIEVKANKMHELLYEHISAMPQGEEKKFAFDNMSDYSKVLSWGKANGWIPDGYQRPHKRLIDDGELFGSTPEQMEDWEMQLLLDVYTESLDLAFAGVVDYDDQILMPTLFQSVFPRPAVTLIDEAQDLSPLNHAMLKKLVGTRRLIAVGDECQAIYGFRGADASSMRKLQEEFSMTKLILSVSFRCPVSVVEHARWRAPHMKYPEWAKPGEVKFLHEWEIADVPEGAAVVCRNNAPLFSLAIKMLKSGRYAQIIGNDIGKGLLKIMKKFGPPNMPQADVLSAIDKWLAGKLAKTREPGPLRDRADCMKVFAQAGETLSGAMSFAEHIFNAQSATMLMTGHKSKGLEFEHVFILERSLLKDEGQDRNLRYVMQTRAKETLTYIDFEGFVENV